MRLVSIHLITDRKGLEEALGFNLEENEWNDPKLLSTLIMENPEVIPRLYFSICIKKIGSQREGEGR